MPLKKFLNSRSLLNGLAHENIKPQLDIMLKENKAMEQPKLTWDEIQIKYGGEWVELTDYDWDDSEPCPSSGVVRVHAVDKNEFYQIASENPPEDGAIIFVGDPVVN